MGLCRNLEEGAAIIKVLIVSSLAIPLESNPANILACFSIPACVEETIYGTVASTPNAGTSQDSSRIGTIEAIIEISWERSPIQLPAGSFPSCPLQRPVIVCLHEHHLFHVGQGINGLSQLSSGMLNPVCKCHQALAGLLGSVLLDSISTVVQTIRAGIAGLF